MTHSPVRPCRLRTRPASKTGWPQFSSCGGEAAARTSQRVSAVLASGSALKRRRKAVTVFCAQASVSRRLAIRSRIFGLPGISMTTAPRAAQESASFAARRASAASPTQSSNMRAGSIPNSRNPVAESSPNSRAEKSCRSRAGVCARPRGRRGLPQNRLPPLHGQCLRKPHAARRAQARPSGKDRRRRGRAECGWRLPPPLAGKPGGPLSFRAHGFAIMRRAEARRQISESGQEKHCAWLRHLPKAFQLPMQFIKIIGIEIIRRRHHRIISLLG